MNKKKLQEFATWAKQNLERQIELSLKKIGIYSDSDIKQSKVQGDVTIIEGVETTFKKQFNNQREEIINVIKDDGYKHTVEQFASTWFNRIVALRFLEVHDYLDHGFKLFPKGTNTLPEILSKLALVKNDLKLDMRHIEELVSSGKNNEELYRLQKNSFLERREEIEKLDIQQSIGELEKLNISFFRTTNFLVAKLKSNSLKYLHLNIQNESQFSSIEGIQNMPNLESITIINAPALTNIPSVLKLCKSKIKHITIQNCKMVNVVEIQTYCQTNNIKLEVS